MCKEIKKEKTLTMGRLDPKIQVFLITNFQLLTTMLTSDSSIGKNLMLIKYKKMMTKLLKSRRTKPFSIGKIEYKTMLYYEKKLTNTLVKSSLFYIIK